MKNNSLFLTICLLLMSYASIGQLYEVPLNQRIDKSAYIFE